MSDTSPGLEYAITFPRGGDFELSYIYKDPLGVPINMTGYAFTAAVRKDPDDATALLLSTIGNGGIVVDIPTGKVTVKFRNADTVNVPHGDYLWDLWQVLPSGNKERVLYGTCAIQPRIAHV